MAERKWQASGLLLLGAMSSVCAHEPAPAKTTMLPEVVIDGHYDNAVGTSDAASQGVITRRLVGTRPQLRPAEVLEFVPGMVVTQHSGDGKANQYFLRGFNLDHGTDFATSVAGMPVNLPTHAHGHGYTDLNFLIPELISHIHYRKGPYYAGTGDFSSAGSADIFLLNRFAGPMADLTLGQRGYRRAVLGFSPTLANGASLLVAIEGLGNNGPWVNPQDLKKWNGVVRYSDIAGDHRYAVTLMGYQANWKSTDQVPLNAIALGQISRFGAIDPTDGGKTSRYSLSGEWKRSFNGGYFEASLYSIRYKLNLFSNFTYFLDNPVEGDQFEQADNRRVFGGALKGVWNGKLGSRDMSNEFGLQYRRDRMQVGLFNTIAQQRSSTTRDDAVRQSGMALYWENNLSWTSWLRSVAGLRADRFSFNVNSDTPANSGETLKSLLSPKLSFVFGPWAKTEYFVNWGRGFHSNDARGTVATIDPGDPTVSLTRVPGLVKTSGSELGVRTELIPRLQSSLALWQLRIGSELVFVGDAGITEPSRPTKRHGIEWSNRYKPLPWLLFDADMAWTHARFSDSDPAGDRIPGAPNRVASVAVAVKDFGPWSGSLQLRHIGPRPLIEDNNVKSDPLMLFNARVGYRIAKNADIRLDVFNLTNRKANDIDYFYESRPVAAGPALFDRHIHPVEPRTLRVSLRLGI